MQGVRGLARDWSLGVLGPQNDRRGVLEVQRRGAMSWVKIDDHAPQHPKMVQAGAEAFALWVAGNCYSNAHTLDGRLPKKLLGTIYSPLSRKASKLARVLCDVGLWHDRGDHYEIHDYAKYQSYSLKANVEARRQHDRARKRPSNDQQIPAGIQSESSRIPTASALETGRDGTGTYKHEERESLAVGDSESRADAALARLKAVS
jgi:hypothetical protein